ncbi:MAG: ParB/RepB/Spo0J family partition protein [Planctomycetes bacterium]|nr:ParB/RepB/Spo0J family partition protein [Planctomycetota bacterium]
MSKANVTKERRLGRGLEALLGRSPEKTVEPTTDSLREEIASTQQAEVKLGLVTADDDTALTQDDSGQQWLELGAITANPYQPRQHFDEAEIADLCDSIRSHGFLQPIVVRQVGDQYQIIAGERRYRAAQLASWERVPVQVREVDDRQMTELAIVENVQRKDLNAIEKATSFHRYLQEYGCTQEELASRVNIDRSTVANLVRLLELPEQVKRMVVDGDLSQGHARSLLPLGDEYEQCKFAKQIKSDSLSVRATEQLVQEHIRDADGEQLSVLGADGGSRDSKPQAAGQHLSQLEERLRLALGTKVDLKQTAKGRGRITIHFKNHEEFERIQQILTSERAAA